MPYKKELSFKRQHSAEYECWVNMLHRCHNPHHANYDGWGGRGIAVCDAWRHADTGFARFLSDMGRRPESYSIERVDNSKGYSPDNCKWADSKTQMANRRRYTRSAKQDEKIAWMGQTKTLAEWSEVLEIRVQTLRYRLKLGMSVDDAFTTPLRGLTFERKQRISLSALTIY